MDLMESWETTKLEFNPDEEDYGAAGTLVIAYPHTHVQTHTAVAQRLPPFHWTAKKVVGRPIADERASIAELQAITGKAARCASEALCGATECGCSAVSLSGGLLCSQLQRGAAVPRDAAGPGRGGGGAGRRLQRRAGGRRRPAALARCAGAGLGF